MFYEWDEAKRVINLGKHGYDFVDANRVLESEIVQVVDSERVNRQGLRETRRQAFAYVFEELAVLTVAFVQHDAQRCRVISFRPANCKERSGYYAWLEKADRDDQ